MPAGKTSMGRRIRQVFGWALFVNALTAGVAFCGNDDARAIAVDSSENIYVTGSSEGSGTRRDFFTQKLNANGAVLWTARFDGTGSGEDIPNAIVVDQFGNVFVTGSSLGLGSGLDYLTVKYNSSGVFQWAVRFNGTGNREDIPYAMDVDPSGNIYVTGSSQSTNADRDSVTIKYNANGGQVWTFTWIGSGGEDIARALKIDMSGNVYVAGSSTGNGSGLDYILLKFNTNGALQWWRSYNGPANGDDVPAALAFDPAGKVYVTGSSLGVSSGNDFATLKYSPNGVLKWVQRYDGPAGSSDKSVGIAVDATGVVVTGTSLGVNTASDYATIKYTKKGARLWVARFDGPVSSDDTASALALDGSSNVYVTGTSVGNGTGKDYATLKYNLNGVLQWIARFNGPVNSSDTAAALGVHQMSHNVYVTGSSLGNGTANDFATVKHDGNGNIIWVNRFDQP
ncbi:MAG: hypothetical protein QOG48_956 [Verrucomicrobiota bacterium]|jgi:uncharacterized delta-60 repeat protein